MAYVFLVVSARIISPKFQCCYYQEVRCIVSDAILTCEKKKLDEKNQDFLNAALGAAPVTVLDRQLTYLINGGYVLIDFKRVLFSTNFST